MPTNNKTIHKFFILNGIFVIQCQIVETIESVGVKELHASKKSIKILKPFMVGDENSFIKVSPSEKLSIDYTIVYDHSLIKKQNFVLESPPLIFYKDQQHTYEVDQLNNSY